MAEYSEFEKHQLVKAYHDLKYAIDTIIKDEEDMDEIGGGVRWVKDGILELCGEWDETEYDYSKR